MPGQPPVIFKPSPAEQTLRNTLALAIDGVIKTDIEDLVQTSRLGNEMDFRELRPLFEKTILLFQALSTANLDFATETRLQRLANDATGIKNEFDQFKTFPPSQLPNRRARIDQYKRRFEEVYESVAPVLGVSQHANLEQYEARAKASLNLLEEDRGKFDSQKAEMERELKETLLKAKETAQKVGIAAHAAYFRTESREHENGAKIWLVITVLLAVATAIFAGWNYRRTFALLEAPPQLTGTSPTALPAGAIVQLAIAKFIIFSVMFSAVLWAARIYRAHRHNYVINKHRQNALSTFEAFAKAAGDSETKNAVLLQATQCIFSPQSTGYLGQEKDSEGHSSILEIIRSLPSSKT